MFNTLRIDIVLKPDDEWDPNYTSQIIALTSLSGICVSQDYSLAAWALIRAMSIIVIISFPQRRYKEYHSCLNKWNFIADFCGDVSVVKSRNSDTIVL